eukprot:804635-Prorocentrum_minimum.AAC.2
MVFAVFAPSLGIRNNFEHKNRIDAVYDARKGLADELKAKHYQGNIYRSKMPKSVDINSSRFGDPRASNSKVVRKHRVLVRLGVKQLRYVSAINVIDIVRSTEGTMIRIRASRTHH